MNSLERPLSALADHGWRCPAVGAGVHWTTNPTQPLSISHQGQFPAVTISFNLAKGSALSEADDAISQGVRQDLNGLPATGSRATFQGTAQAFQHSLSSEPFRC